MASTGSHGLRRLLIAVIVLIVVLVAADRIALVVAEHAAATTIEQSQGLSSEPDVDVHGFPFLTQLAASSYDEITVTASDVAVGGGAHPLLISTLRVDLRDVDTSRDFSRVHAARATASARIGLAALSRTLGITLTYAGNGRIRAGKSFTVAGQTITPTITTTPVIRGDTLAFTSAAIDAAGPVASQVSSALEKIFDVTIPLAAIPFHIRVTHLGIGKDGLSLSLAGADLTYDNS